MCKSVTVCVTHETHFTALVKTWNVWQKKRWPLIRVCWISRPDFALAFVKLQPPSAWAGQHSCASVLMSKKRAPWRKTPVLKILPTQRSVPALTPRSSVCSFSDTVSRASHVQDTLVEQLKLCVDYLWKSERYELIADINKPVIAVFEKRRDFKVSSNLHTCKRPQNGVFNRRVCVSAEVVRAVLRHPSLLPQSDRGGELREAPLWSLLPRSFLRSGESQSRDLGAVFHIIMPTVLCEAKEGFGNTVWTVGHGQLQKWAQISFIKFLCLLFSCL